MISQLRAVQREYFALLNSHLQDVRREFEASQTDSSVFAADCIRRNRSGLQAVVSGDSMSLIEYQVKRLCDEAVAFWDSRRDTFWKTIEASSANKVFLIPAVSRIAASCRSMALYADTTVVNDALATDWGETFTQPSGEFMRVMALAAFLEQVQLESLCLADTETPIVIICPSPWAKTATATATFTDNGLRYVGEMFGMTGEVTFGQLTEHIRGMGCTETPIKRPELLPRLPGATDDPEDRLAHILHHSASPTGLSEAIGRELASRFTVTEIKVWLLYMWISGRFGVIQERLDASWRLDLSPKIDPWDWPMLNWKLHRDSQVVGYTFAQHAADVNVCTANLGGSSPKWLANVPADVLVRLRERGEMEELRQVLRGSRTRLKTVSIDEYESVAKDVGSNIDEAIREHQHELAQTNKQYWSRLGVDLVSCAASASIGIASSLLPPLAVPGLMLSVTLGGKSIKDMVNDHLAGRRKMQELRDRPVAVLMDLRDEYTRSEMIQR